MIKLIIASASVVAVLGLAACSDSADDKTTTQSTPPATTTEPATPQATPPATDGTTQTDPNAMKPAPTQPAPAQ